MGMEHYEGPRRRRVGEEDGRVQQTVRLTGEARSMVSELQQPGVLMPDGCSLGDVIELAISEFASTQQQQQQAGAAAPSEGERRHHSGDDDDDGYEDDDDDAAGG